MNLNCNITEYLRYLRKHPKRANKKILAVYEYLDDMVKNGRSVEYLNKATGELEKKDFVFDIEKAQRPIRFIEKMCKHSKGKWAGQPIVLQLWQKAFIEALFGFVDKDTGIRKYKKGLLFVGRKNGKSVIDSALGLYMFTKDGEGGAEIYSVATQREQAKIVWEEAKRMVKKSPALLKRIRTLVTGMYFDATESTFKALASESNSLDGLNSHFVIADEVHAWKDKNLLDVMFDSMSAREQPMLLETSTMGTIRENVFDNEYEYASNLIEGKIQDETLLPVIYELDSVDEWQNEISWYKANPRIRNNKEYQRC